MHIWHSGKAASFIHKNTETVFQKQHEKSVITEAQESMDQSHMWRFYITGREGKRNGDSQMEGAL